MSAQPQESRLEGLTNGAEDTGDQLDAEGTHSPAPYIRIDGAVGR